MSKIIQDKMAPERLRSVSSILEVMKRIMDDTQHSIGLPTGPIPFRDIAEEFSA